MTNPVKLLSDDALREIEVRANAATDGPWQRGGNYWDINTVSADAGKYFIADCHKNPLSAEFIAHAREDIPALCQTVRALRAEREKAIGLLSPNIPRTDLCDAARQIVFAHALEKGNAEKLQEKNAALREQLAEAQKNLRIRHDLIRGWQRHVQRMATILDCEALDIKVEHATEELRQQLAEVTQERDRAKEDLRILTQGRFMPQQ